MELQLKVMSQVKEHEPQHKLLCTTSGKKSVKTKAGNRRHTKSRETPLVIYNSLKLYSEPRSKTAIDDLHAPGLSISYQKVLDITKNLYESV